MVGRKGGGDYSGIAIPYFHPGAERVRDYRLRRDHPDMEYDGSGSLKVKQKYLSPPGRSNMLYLPPRVPQSQLRDPELPVVITEGVRPAANTFEALATANCRPSAFLSFNSFLFHPLCLTHFLSCPSVVIGANLHKIHD
jgi:hypothetical protein